MNNRTRAIAALAIVMAFPLSAAAQHAHHQRPAEAASALSEEAKTFVAENDAAMERMMAAMHVAPTGDVDRDFIAMMIPHHQGAIDMSRAVLRSSRNVAVRRLAQEIIVTQEDEIRAMRLAIDPPAAAALADVKTEQDR
ncbi:DUF305 domain-containing protein [Paracoccus nototheniae]|uniref:DUF305 domain-containing protein n=1 Tax=Paracoccus nototheniae TaxID=2489002 RepID=A0ABW4DUG7_9RHOB|nr:DUF305 domain-containing protein [Paracoccus nototheniae]